MILKLTALKGDGTVPGDDLAGVLECVRRHLQRFSPPSEIAGKIGLSDCGWGLTPFCTVRAGGMPTTGGPMAKGNIGITPGSLQKNIWLGWRSRRATTIKTPKCTTTFTTSGAHPNAHKAASLLYAIYDALEGTTS